jgi:hypothetical protein
MHPKISITWSFPQRATAAGLVLVGAIAIAIFFFEQREKLY